MTIKGILEYDLNDYDAALAHKRACNADNAYLTLTCIQHILKDMWESCEEGDSIDEYRKRIANIIEKYGINTEDLP